MAARLEKVALGGDGTADEDGRLLFIDDRLIAVLSLLSDLHGPLEGHWFMEAGFGLSERDEPFATLEEATRWIAERLRGA